MDLELCIYIFFQIRLYQLRQQMDGRNVLLLIFSLYFMMTGLHGLHVLIGIGILVWIMLRAKKNEFSSEFYTPVELVGLYWHFVDLVWIYLFPLLYLIR